jgi:hypothetical protein
MCDNPLADGSLINPDSVDGFAVVLAITAAVPGGALQRSGSGCHGLQRATHHKDPNSHEVFHWRSLFLFAIEFAAVQIAVLCDQ